jgi:hypothetical protein
MWLPAKLALACLLASLAACDSARSSAPAPSSRATASSARQGGNPAPLIPRPDVLRFRRGLIDNTGWHGTRDARLYPDGRLAVLTYGGGCPLKPVLPGVENASHVDVTYAPVPGDGPVCLTFLGPYTAVLKLPRTVNLDRPLAVTVHFADSEVYTLTARSR